MKPMAQTLPEMFRMSVDRFPEVPALMGSVKGKYHSITYGQMAEMVRSLGRGLIALGIMRMDHVGLLSENLPEWAVTDMALAHIGAVNVAIFPSIPPGQVKCIISDSGAKIIVVSGLAQLKKALEIRKENKHLRIISMEIPPEGIEGVVTFDELRKLGESSAYTDGEFEKRHREIRPDDWASIIYTSGTTGDPKGVILSHGNFVSNVISARKVLPFDRGDVLLSFVPLNHVMGRLADHYLPLSTGATVAYVENLLRLRQNLMEVKPHYMLLVPRVLQMIQEGIVAAVAQGPAVKQKIFNWALAVGKECYRELQEKKKPSPMKSLLWSWADRLVYKNIRSGLGLQRLRFFFSGGAPLPYATAQFFAALKINIMEGYGLTETSPLVTVNPSHLLKHGTVGLPIEGVEVKLAHDGEIFVRGPNVMKGYYNKPADTAEAIDPDGWLHTGDIGQFDEDGYLSITDRKKNLIILSNSKKIAPQAIENRLMESPFIAHAIIVGDGRATPAALLFPALDHLRDWATSNTAVVDLPDNSALAKHPRVASLIRSEIARLLPDLADFEKIRTFAIIDEELTVDNGALTPTLKVKKREILERYKDVIEEMYR